ncbi:hypothetical protein ACOSP7_019453 [Xanthoceras sorbifolium]
MFLYNTYNTLQVGQPSSHTQAVPESSSQPVTENAPLFDSQQRTHHTRSRSNPGTVAGLNMDWSPTF